MSKPAGGSFVTKARSHRKSAGRGGAAYRRSFWPDSCKNAHVVSRLSCSRDRARSTEPYFRTKYCRDGELSICSAVRYQGEDSEGTLVAPCGALGPPLLTREDEAPPEVIRAAQSRQGGRREERAAAVVLLPWRRHPPPPKRAYRMGGYQGRSLSATLPEAGARPSNDEVRLYLASSKRMGRPPHVFVGLHPPCTKEIRRAQSARRERSVWAGCFQAPLATFRITLRRWRSSPHCLSWVPSRS